MSSANGIVKQSRSRQRYVAQDLLLRAYVKMPNATAKEVAKSELLNWSDEKYSSAPKRAHDLASDKLGYLVMTGDRVCKITGAVAHTYRITDRGMAYLQRKGLHRVESSVTKPASRDAARSALSDIRNVLQ